jgi:hypothetical protein
MPRHGFSDFLSRDGPNFGKASLHLAARVDGDVNPALTGERYQASAEQCDAIGASGAPLLKRLEDDGFRLEAVE